MYSNWNNFFPIEKEKNAVAILSPVPCINITIDGSLKAIDFYPIRNIFPKGGDPAVIHIG
jgi:hypothetical protein